ncbi:MAG: acetylxylan esterase [Planctomycetes bacterium]|nr:acetylxylan esterase [Planctomycetota bacterium]
MTLHFTKSLSCFFVGVIWFAGLSAGADDFRVFPEPPARTASPFYQHLLSQAETAIDRRTQAWNQVQTPEQVRAWQKERREIFLRQIGPFPERTPLNARVTGTLKGDGYRVEKVMYESRPNHHVTALLYLPEGKQVYPAVLVPCGHSHDGKAGESYQRVCILLAKNGMAALCYDPIGQGERYQCFGPNGRPLVSDYKGQPGRARYLGEIPGQPVCDCVEEHTLIGLSSILLGTNTANYRIWDGMRSIDYLVSRPEIDAKRIGCTGNSGGGTLTAYLMALDDRIACAAPVCYLTSFRRLLQTSGPQDAEQNIFGQLALGLDEADFIHMRAPKPTALMAGTRDATFDITGTWDVFREAKRFYARLDHPERIELVESDAPHGFTVQLRVGAVRWMRRWLLGKDDAITEPELEVRRPADLWCTPKGQVMFLSGERSVFDMHQEREKALAKQRATYWKETPRPQALARIREIAGIRPLEKLPAASHRLIERIKRDGYVIDKLALKVEADYELPALAFVPAQPNGDAYLYLHGDGKQVDAGPDGPIMKLVRQGHLVLAVDLRGLGENQRRHPRDWGRALFGPNTQEFFVAYLLGRSLVGIWTEDTLICSRFLAGYRTKETRKVHLIGVESAGIPSLHAATLEPNQFASLTLRRTLVSWASIVETPMAGNQLPVAVHGALLTYDLPDLVREIEGNRIMVEEPRNAAGKGGGSR